VKHSTGKLSKVTKKQILVGTVAVVTIFAIALFYMNMLIERGRGTFGNRGESVIVNNEIQTYTVERVIDGDTLKLTNGEEVQLIGIQAPEDKKMGQEATEFVKKVLEDNNGIRLEFDVQERDKYGRLLAYVYISTPIIKFPGNKDGTTRLVYVESFLNKLIIQKGYATPMTIPPNVKYADLFKELFKEAVGEHRGLWQSSCTEDKECSFINCSSYLKVCEPICVFNQCACKCP